VRDEGTSVATNSDDEDASTVGLGTDGSGVIFVSNSKDDSSLSWSRYQQKQLEWALAQYPKFAKERWENISKAVPGKSKVRNYSHIDSEDVTTTSRLPWGCFFFNSSSCFTTIRVCGALVQFGCYQYRQE
jgi:hypothetical protein